MTPNVRIGPAIAVLVGLWIAISLLMWLLGGCAFVDGLHQFRSGKSEPAYPPYISQVPCTWYEGGKVWHVPPIGIGSSLRKEATP